MSVTGITWQPKSGQSLDTDGNIVDVARALEKAFGKFPIELKFDDVHILLGLSAYYSANHGDDNNPFQQLIDAVNVHDNIRLETW